MLASLAGWAFQWLVVNQYVCDTVVFALVDLGPESCNSDKHPAVRLWQDAEDEDKYAVCAKMGTIVSHFFRNVPHACRPHSASHKRRLGHRLRGASGWTKSRHPVWRFVAAAQFQLLRVLPLTAHDERVHQQWFSFSLWMGLHNILHMVWRDFAFHWTLLGAQPSS